MSQSPFRTNGTKNTPSLPCRDLLHEMSQIWETHIEIAYNPASAAKFAELAKADSSGPTVSFGIRGILCTAALLERLTNFRALDNFSHFAFATNT